MYKQSCGCPDDGRTAVADCMAAEEAAKGSTGSGGAGVPSHRMGRDGGMWEVTMTWR